MRVLLVEDNQIEAELLRDLLAEGADEPWQIRHVTTLQEALAWLSGAPPPDVVLLDLNLPDVLGLDGLRKLERGWPELPVVVLSNAREPGIAEQLLQEGAQDFLPKARLRSATLFQAIAKALARQAFSNRARSAAGAPQAGLAAPTASMVDLVRRDIARLQRSGEPPSAVVALRCTAGDHGAAKELTKRLETGLRGADRWAQIGGEVFVLLLASVNSADQAVRVVRRLLPGEAQGARGQALLRIGIALYGADEKAPAAVLERATAALRTACRERLPFWVADEALHRQAVRSLTTEEALVEALEHGDLQLQYQPVVMLGSGRVRGFEALLRWRHPERGELPAREFVDVIARSALCEPVSWYVLTEAVRQLARWQRLFPVEPPMTMSINLPGRCLESPTFATRLLALIAEQRLDPCCLQLEVDAAGICQARATGLAQRRALRGAGVAINMDGFDPGGLSIAGLWRGEFDALKIGRGPLHGAWGRLGEERALASLLELGRLLGAEVVAKGVETEAQAAWLREAGCEYAQGHWYARAMSSAAATELLARGGGAADGLH